MKPRHFCFCKQHVRWLGRQPWLQKASDWLSHFDLLFSKYSTTHPWCPRSACSFRWMTSSSVQPILRCHSPADGYWPEHSLHENLHFETKDPGIRISTSPCAELQLPSFAAGSRGARWCKHMTTPLCKLRGFQTTSFRVKHLQRQI